MHDLYTQFEKEEVDQATKAATQFFKNIIPRGREEFSGPLALLTLGSMLEGVICIGLMKDIDSVQEIMLFLIKHLKEMADLNVDILEYGDE